MSKTNRRYQIESLTNEDGAVQILWRDGHRSSFPSIWLLEACACERCGNTETAVRHVKLIDKPPRPNAQSCTHDDAQLHIDWGDGHRSNYDLTWLRCKCLSPEAIAERNFEAKTWGREMLNRLPCMDYAGTAAAPAGHLRFLESLLDCGFAILRDVPAESERTAEIAALVGKLRLTNYEIYELKSKPDPEIVGDMAVAIPPHTDEPYRIDPPGITFFHVIKQAQAGGATTLIDSFRLADRLRRINPDAYEILRSVPARHHRNLLEGRRFEYQSPIIQTDSDGRVSAVRLLDRGMAPVDCALQQVEPFYAALRELLKLVYSGEDTIEFRLESGEMLVFNNQRLMHGRTAFDPAEGRHVRSCHVDLDEFHSRLRFMYRDAGDPRQWMNFRKG